MSDTKARTEIVVLASLLALSAGAGIGHTLLARDLATAPAAAPASSWAPNVKPSTPTHKQLVAQASATYHTNLGPSLAWQRASTEQRRHAEASYLAEFGSWNNGCHADLEHAYQGTTGENGLRHVQPWLPTSRHDVPGRDIYLGEFVKGVCSQ